MIQPIALICLSVAMGMLFADVASADGPAVGETAPPLKLAKVLQASTNASANWESLRGTTVVLDFWATWCGPCVESMPHWNELVDSFKGQPVQFIAVTDENEQVVTSFLERTPIHSWVGLTGVGQSMFEAYRLRGIPTTVIVNDKGFVAGVTHPALLGPKHITEVIRTGVSSLPPRKDSDEMEGAETESLPAQKLLFELSARRSPPRPKGRGFNSWGVNESRTEVTGTFASIESAILSLFHSRRALMDSRVELPREEYDFTVRIPDIGRAERDQLFNSFFRTTFGVQVRRVPVEREVLVMKVAAGNAPGLIPSGPNSPRGGGGQNGGLNLSQSSLNNLPSYLESWLGKPVIDETGVTNRYDIRLRWKMSKRELLLVALDRAVLRVALEPDAEREEKLSAEQRRYLAAIRGQLSDAELQTLPVEDRENARLFRTELAKPDHRRFGPEPDAIISAVEEQLGLSLSPARRTVETLVVENAEPLK